MSNGTYSTEAGLAATVTPPGDGRGSGAPSRSHATVGKGVALYLVVVALFIGASLGLLPGWHLGGLAVLQVGTVLLPALVYAALVRFSPRRDLWVRRARARHLIGAALAGAGIWFVLVSTVLAVQNQIFEPPQGFLEQREALFLSTAGPWDWLWVWSAAALTPALCEEFLFRGVLLQSFRPAWGESRAVAVTAALFALFHMNPYQLSVTFVLGCLLGWLVVRTRSLLAPITFHLVNNTVVLAAARTEADTVPWQLALLFVILAVVGLAAVGTGGASRSDPDLPETREDTGNAGERNRTRARKESSSPPCGDPPPAIQVRSRDRE